MSEPEATSLPTLTSATPVRQRRPLDYVQSARGFWVVALLALLLGLPSLSSGLTTDDHVARGIGLARPGLLPDPFTAFGLEPKPGFDRDSGHLAWWSSPQLRLMFLRPLTSLTHADYVLWSNAPWAMHAVNVLLYALMAAIAWFLYRALLPSAPPIAAMAALLFAIDEAHAPALGWIASRNTLLSSLLGLTALLMHVRGRRHAGAAFLALALLAGEGGCAVLAYLFAYAVCLESGTLRARLATLAPALAVSALWAVVYIAGGYGARGSTFYRDLSEPLHVLAQGLMDLPTWIFGLVGPSVIGLSMAAPAAPVRAAGLLLAAPLIVGLAFGLPRTRENGFFALGALLCLPPLFTTLPQDRILMLASFGALGVIASFLAAARSSASAAVRGIGRVLFGIHAVLAPLLFLPGLNQTRPVEHGSQAVVRALPQHAPPQVILVNAPVELLTLYAPFIAREQADRTPPTQLQQLYAGASTLTAKRVDERTLELDAANGWAAVPVETIFGRVEDMPRGGEVLALKGLEVRVQDSTADGRPKRVHFRFPTPLEDSERLFLSWQGRNPVAWQPPSIGSSEPLQQLGLHSLEP